MNKVQFGLKNAHYAVINEQEGMISYGTPVRHPGLVTMTLEPKGETSDFFADDIILHTTSTNQGYDVTVEFAVVTEAFRTDVLGEILDVYDGVLVENANAKPKKIAFFFEFDGDVKATRYVLLYCSVSRPGLNSSTKTESAEPGTTEVVLVASPRPTDGNVKFSTASVISEEVYNAWYSRVWAPTGA